MAIVDKLLKIAGKNNFLLDERISTCYVLRLCWKYGWMMARGKIFALGYKGIAESVFIGKNIKILEKRYLTVGSKTKLHDGVYIDALSTNGVRIGNQVVLGRNTRIECTGGLSSLGKGIKIGDKTTFGNDCFFGAAGGIEIGEDVIGGQWIHFHSENHKYSDLNVLIKDQGVTHKGIRVGNNCWIGSGAIFLDGAELSDGCIVAAGAVVTKKFPKDVVVGGIPAKILRTRR